MGTDGAIPLPGPLRLTPTFAFAGRERELATLRALLPRSTGEGRRAAFLAGEAGSGKSRLVREYLDSTRGAVQMALLPAYAPDLNPVEYLWAWLKRHALANFCPAGLAELKHTARCKLKSGQKRQSIITACWDHAGLQ